MTDHPLADSKIESEPGAIRALRSHSSDAFNTLFHRALRNAQEHRGDPEGLGHVKLVAQIARELEQDPLKLQIAAPKIKKHLSYMEKKSANNQLSSWNVMIQLLSSPHLRNEDWMTIFGSLANSVEGKERDDGMSLVKEAISRVDMAVQAIEAFPRLFRSARNKDPEETALMIIAKGEINYPLWRHEADCSAPGSAIELGVKIVQALRRVKVNEKYGSILFHASLADFYKDTLLEEGITFGIFKKTHGLKKLMESKSPDGVQTLMWVSVKPLLLDEEGHAEHLLKLGFDPNIRDSAGQKPLIKALLTRKNSAALLHVFASNGAITSEDVLKLSKSPDAIMDPASRAYIASKHAALMIDEMITIKTLSGLSP